MYMLFKGHHTTFSLVPDSFPDCWTNNSVQFAILLMTSCRGFGYDFDRDSSQYQFTKLDKNVTRGYC